MEVRNKSVRMISNSILALDKQSKDLSDISKIFLDIMQKTCADTMSSGDYDLTVFEDNLYDNINADTRISDEMKDRPEKYLDEIVSLATDRFPLGIKTSTTFSEHREEQIKRFDSAFAFVNSYHDDDDERHHFVEDVKEAVDASGVVILVQDVFDEVVYAIVSDMADPDHETEEDALKAAFISVEKTLGKAGDRQPAENSRKIMMTFLGSLRAGTTPDPSPGL